MRMRSQEQLTIDDAMLALKSKNTDAREWTKSLADVYRQILCRRAPKFSELRQALRKEAESARQLARLMSGTIKMMDAAFPFLSGGGCPQEMTFRWRDIAKDLELHAAEIDGLEKKLRWPIGGDWDLAKACLGGNPKQWLARQGLRAFSRWGNPDEIQALSAKKGSPYGDYVRAVYQVATGEDPDGRRVGLAKAIDEAARTHRRTWQRKRKPISPQPPQK